MRTLYVDGGCENNGNSLLAKAYGSCYDGESLHRFDLPEATTNNEAEYMSLIYSLRYVARDGDSILMDSMLVVETSMGRWKVRADNLKPLQKQAQALMAQKRVDVQWIPRERIVAQLGH